jgi:hypothetical protein
MKFQSNFVKFSNFGGGQNFCDIKIKNLACEQSSFSMTSTPSFAAKSWHGNPSFRPKPSITYTSLLTHHNRNNNW